MTTGFADLHNHVVPEVDDGSRSMEESVEALRDFQREGVRALAATPHLYLQFLPGVRELDGRIRQLREAFERLRQAAGAGGDTPALHRGAEICAHDAAAARRIVDHAEVGIGDTRFLLIEFGFELEGDPDAVIRTVRDAGREIIVAHPERYRFPQGTDALATMRRWRDAGAFLQINVGSLHAAASAYGSEAEQLGWQLLDEGVAHLISSDHHCRARPQILHRAVHEAIRARGGGAQADLLLGENPMRVLQGLAPLEVGALCSVAGGR
jgi:protein-tyrosine phosphatase